MPQANGASAAAGTAGLPHKHGSMAKKVPCRLKRLNLHNLDLCVQNSQLGISTTMSTPVCQRHKFCTSSYWKPIDKCLDG